MRLNSEDLQEVEAIIKRLMSQFSSIEDLNFQRACALEVPRLPLVLRQYLNEISANLRNEGYYMISGFQIDDEEIGDTPTHWDAPWSDTKYFREEVFQCLISSALGSLFGWRTQENGRLLRHIVPIKKDENEQLGGSSKAQLVWHTEEAFHPAKADFFSLMCYRNIEKAETLFVNINKLDLDAKSMEILKQDRFFIQPDQSHLQHNNISDHWQINNSQFSRIEEMVGSPPQYPILYGTNDNRMMNIDKAFMYVADDDIEAKTVLDEFHALLDLKAEKVVMNPGDIVLIDNLSTAHARSSYKPNYGSKQRWMRRVNIRNGRRSHLNHAEFNNSHIMA